MCDPTGGVLTAALLAGGAAVTAYGQYQVGQYEQKVANMNAKLAGQQARDAEARGNIAEQTHLQKVRQMLGAQRARLGASGIEVNSGTALDLTTDTARMGAMDALTIRNNAAREAWGYRVQGVNYKAQGELAAAQGTNQAMGTLLTGGSQAYGTWKKG